MGLNGAKPMKIDAGFIWQGDKNLVTYEQEFEIHLLSQSK
jgi:hypothetical protein